MASTSGLWAEVPYVFCWKHNKVKKYKVKPLGGFGDFWSLNTLCLGGLLLFSAKTVFCGLSSLIETYLGTQVSDTLLTRNGSKSLFPSMSNCHAESFVLWAMYCLFDLIMLSSLYPRCPLQDQGLHYFPSQFLSIYFCLALESIVGPFVKWQCFLPGRSL